MNKYKVILIIIGIILTERIGWYLYISFPRTIDIKIFFTIRNTVMIIPFMIDLFIFTWFIAKLINIIYDKYKKEKKNSTIVI